MATYAPHLPEREPHQQLIEADVVYRRRPEVTLGIIVAPAWPPSEFSRPVNRALARGADIQRADGTCFDGDRRGLTCIRFRVIERGYGLRTRVSDAHKQAASLKDTGLKKPPKQDLDPDFMGDVGEPQLWRLKPERIDELYAGRRYNDVLLRRGRATAPPQLIRPRFDVATGGGSLAQAVEHRSAPSKQAGSRIGRGGV